MLGDPHEHNPTAARPCHVCTGPLSDGCTCELETSHTGELGAILIRQERVRQIDVKGNTPFHDDTHENGELAEAARAYLWHAITAEKTGRVAQNPPPGWPFLAAEFRSRNGLESLVKAGALIAAEIDRLARLHPGLLDYRPTPGTHPRPVHG